MFTLKIVAQAFLNVWLFPCIFLAEDCNDNMDIKDIVGRCKLTDIEACGINQICVQTHPEDKEWGNCMCYWGYHLENQNVSHVTFNIHCKKSK